MVAKITTPGSVSKALNYNEKKVQKGVAECLYAGNFLKDAKHLNFGEKLDHFSSLTRLNTRAKTNTLHVSLNFDPSEKLAQEKLVRIAAAYMAKIGFGQQPYLVYEHRDAGHPHIHIVTTLIRENGKRIATQNLGKNQSQRARKEIEESFGLVKATGKNTALVGEEENRGAQKIRYGKDDTKRSITAVLNRVINRYHFSSLHQLNAVLKAHNLMADSGAEGSRMYKNGGLTYRVLDEGGNKIGVPIKASSIPFKPTLKYLEERFKKGDAAKLPFRQKLKTSVDFVMYQKPENMDQFIHRLKEEKVTVVPRTNREGLTYGITFIDHRTGCVYNGSDLGKDYSAAAIQQRILEGAGSIEASPRTLLERVQNSFTASAKTDSKKEDAKEAKGADIAAAPTLPTSKSADLLDALLSREKGTSNVPFPFRKKKKKKKGFNL